MDKHDLPCGGPSHRAPRVALLTVLAVVVLVAASVTGAAGGLQPADEQAADRLHFGVVFMSSAEDRAAGSGRTSASIEQQYQNGLSTGATWNRWPLYWFNIEQSPGVFNWATQDATVIADVAHGLQLNAILLGTPAFYTTGDAIRAGRVPRPRAGQLSLDAVERATPLGLYESVFADGTDTLAAGKPPNPANKWAVFVTAAVNRYKPGGVLAQAHGWPAGVGVTHWEMWNEPDLDIFWDASVEDYARLLKVGYLATKASDPGATALFAGLANSYNELDYYRQVLTILAADPQARSNDFYHDILATHSYFHSWKSWFHVFRARGAMRGFGFEKPIWLNESGVPAWDDYPGPVWDPQSALRATTDEQASYVIQSAFYAIFAGADAVFHFQLYDGCGNQPAGTNFPPHNGELCDGDGLYNGKPCAGDANGLFTNPTDMACFTQHPRPASARPNAAAFHVLTTYLTGIEPYWRVRAGEPASCPGQVNPSDRTEPQEWIAFYRESTGERIIGMWTLCGREETAIVDATSPDGRAMLVYADGRTQPVAAVQGHYTIALPAATNRNPFPGGASPNPIFPIGGAPVLLIEKDDRGANWPYRGFAPIIAFQLAPP